jgi:N-acetylmuramoyl-L-alanine amidase
MIPQHAKENLGWLTGLEPATARTTIWSSTIELQPPFRAVEATKVPPAAKRKFRPAFAAVIAGLAALLFLVCAAPAAPVIVVDAGHGGHDRGGMPGQRVPEKAYALDVAKRLDRLLRSQGLRTVMTRKSDLFVPLSDRCNIANGQSKAVFVSIHFNGARNYDASGIETYYYKGRESAALAAQIHRKVVASTGAESRFVRARGFYVLRHLRFPGVLCELGFLTNRSEARRIGSSSYRQKLAEAIASVIVARYR